MSQDLRERIVEARGAGSSSAKVAERFAVSVRTVDRYWQRQREQGHCRAGKHGGHLRSRLEGHEDTVRAWIAEKNDLTLEALSRRLHEELGIKLGVSALWYRLEAMGLTYKKKRFAPPSRTGPT
jgi:transposase